ncbi:MAG: PLP-dependent aminotransferase family protein [Ruminococcaceae bacterium]|nr:PLP-dependent aminotransferase family protein [Oscillospiraceae bacterium]
MNYNLSDNIKNMKPSAIREIFKSLGTPGAISFAAGNPSPESFPVEDITRIANKILAENASASLQYGTTEGYMPLRELVTKRIAEKFDCVKEGDMTIITSGGQQGIELFCKVMCNRGDEVICENPSFIGALNAFRSIGAVPVGVPLEDDGINLEILEEVLKTHPKAKFMYLIPTFQNPAGITTTLEKRKAVYALAQKYDVMILEDNPYGELRFAGEDVPTYKSMDTDGRVMYCGSFSKILSAGMRVGFVCGNETVVQKMVVAKQVEDVHTNQFFQMIVAGFMTECDMDAHVAKIRALYKHKAELMIAALDKYMPKEVKFTRPEGGLFLWCTLPEGVSLSDFMKESIAQKVFVVTGKAFNCDEEADSDSFRLNYSMPSDEEIDKGIKILGEIIADLIKKRNV